MDAALLPPGTLEAFGLYLVRTTALVLPSPVLGTGSTFSSYRVGLIGALSMVLFLGAGSPTLGESLGPVAYAVLVAREALIGFALAFVLQAVVVAVRVAGELVGSEMAFNMASVADPATGVNTPIISHFYETLFFLGLLSVNAHQWLIRALSESYARAPVGAVEASGDLPSMALETFTQLFAAGLTFAAPILVLLLIVSLVIGLLTRAVPQINVLEFGFNLRVAAGLGALLLFAPFLTPAMESLLGRLMDGLAAGLDALEV